MKNITKSPKSTFGFLARLSVALAPIDELALTELRKHIKSRAMD